MSAHALDHLVLPVSTLDAARSRLTQLGFTVAPDAVHPFGTSNACVFLPDGTYLEPLAQTNSKLIDAAIASSNVFVARFNAYQFRRNDNGFSAVAFATDDAEADHKRFCDTGWSGGPMLEFSRDFEGPDGAKAKATFRLAFAADPRAPDCLFFTCQRINFPQIDRSNLERHANGVQGIARIVLAAPQAGVFAQSLAAAASVGPESFSDVYDGFVSLQIGDVTFDFMNNSKIVQVFDGQLNDDRGLQGRAIKFDVSNLAAAEALFVANGVGFKRLANRLVVPPTIGQGAIFVFESNHDQA